VNTLVRLAPTERPIATSGSTMEVAVARSLDDLLEVISLRALVYMGEQACPFSEEVDGNDFAGATHLILRAGAEPAGTLRLRWFASFAKLERACVRKEFRGRPATMALIHAGLELARRKGYRKVLGHAQSRVAPFWRRAFGARVRPGRAPFVFSDRSYVEVELDLEPRVDAITIDADPLVVLRPEGAWDVPGVLDRSAARPAMAPLL
jgi:predicted GNAT family N-acyltransferase